MTWLQWLFSNAGFMPRAICGIWTPGMIFLHNASDFLIWTAYIAIPIVLGKFAYAKRRELPFRKLFWLFGLFILACGTTHFMDIVMFYNPLYRLAGIIKLVTAAASWGTVIALFHVMPVALRMRSPEDLQREIEQRKQAEAQLQQAHDHLEVRVQARTSELETSNAELHSSEERFRTMINAIPQLAWIARADGFRFWYNQRWHDYTGTTPEQMEGWGWQSVHDPAALPLVVERWQEAIATGQPFGMELPLRGADGTFRTFLTRAEPVQDAQGRVVRWFGTNTDINDQKRAQGELASSLSLLTATIESTADGIMVLDLSGNIVVRNNKFKTMWRYPDDLFQWCDGPALRAHAAAQVRDPEKFFEVLNRHHAAPEIETFDIIEMKDGRTFERYSFPQFVHQECAGMVVNFRDITERQHAEAEREDLLIREHNAREEAERANAAKDEFLSRLSHELRTPLNAILGFGQVLEMQEKQLTALQNESVQHILKAGQHQLALVDEVLDITRVGSPDSALSLEPVALSEVVQEALDMLQSLAAAAGITILRQLAGDPLAAAPAIFVVADRQRLLQILLNLLTNAIQYNYPGGTVTVTTEVLPETRVRVHVSDTGYGIATEDLPKLFVPFSRLHADKLGVEGTGLGLVLCRRLAGALNGSLHVVSQPGMGSTFSLELAQATAPEAPVAQGPQQVDTSALHMLQLGTIQEVARHQCVLCIEDNLSNLKLMEVIFDLRPGIEFLAAALGRVGLELACQHEPDLILLDLNLPDMHGTAVLARLQESALTRDIPVVVISADALPRQIEILLAAGARGYLTKPLDIEQVLLTVDDLLSVPLAPCHQLVSERQAIGRITPADLGPLLGEPVLVQGVAVVTPGVVGHGRHIVYYAVFII